MYSAVLLPEAKTDIHEAASWYNTRRKGLGKQFTFEVRKTIRLLCDRPEVAPVKYNDARCALLDRFPFMIHFVFDHDSKIIVIVGVFHMSRSPDEWQNRTSL